MNLISLSSYNNIAYAEVENNGRIYIIVYDPEFKTYYCTCPYSVFKKKVCKHILYVAGKIKLEVSSMVDKSIKSGCIIDKLLIDGFPIGTITAVASIPNIGKTKLMLQLALNNIPNNTLIVDTEGERPEDLKSILYRFGNSRGISEEEINKHITIISSQGDLKESSLKKLGKLLGEDINFDVSVGGKITVFSVPNKKELDIERYLTDKTTLLIIDSITNPLKEDIGSLTQNLPARAEVVSKIFKKLYALAKAKNLAVVLTHHISRNPAKPYGKDFGMVWGGDPIIYNSKYIIQLMESTKAIATTKCQGYEEEARRVRVVRHPYLRDDTMYDIRLKKNYGFEDIK